jgi:hypothetical protein
MVFSCIFLPIVFINIDLYFYTLKIQNILIYIFFKILCFLRNVAKKLQKKLFFFSYMHPKSLKAYKKIISYFHTIKKFINMY